MNLQKTLDVLNAMVTARVIGPYAMSGAMAAFRYLEPAVTQDLDVLVSFEPKAGLVTLAPIYSYLKQLGYSDHLDEGIVIEGWPVQFLPVADNLDAEALADAADIEIDVAGEAPVRTRILKPEYLVAIALRTGRPKDNNRIVEFMESGCLDTPKLCNILRQHDGLIGKWKTFCGRFNIADPCN